MLPKIQQFDDRFLATAARIEPDRVLSLIRNVSSAAERQAYYARIAESLAIEHPAEAERVFQLTDDSPRTPMQVRSRIALQLRLCRRLAKSDPARARRIIAGNANAPRSGSAAGHFWRSAWPIGTSRPRTRPWPSQSR